MVAATRWIHKIDGVDLNSGDPFACSVPEADAFFGATTLLTDMQARTPVFNRQQPTPGRFTFLVANVYHSDAEYLANLATLRALVAPGVHTYTRARPGRGGHRQERRRVLRRRARRRHRDRALHGQGHRPRPNLELTWTEPISAGT